jgi:hypothetical protein
MKMAKSVFKNMLWMLAGAALWLAGEKAWKVETVHAQTPLGSEAACVAHIPKAWGAFKGASAYGLVFEDESGRLRFLKSPSCGDHYYTHPAGTPTIDLMMERR